MQELDYAETSSEVTHTFQLSLQMTWEERFRLLGYTTQPELVTARTDSGQLLTAVQPSTGNWNTVTPKSRHVNATLRLSPPPSGARQLDVLKLRWPLFAVGDRQSVVMTDLAAGRTLQQEDMELAVESLEKQSGGRFELVLVVSRDRALPEPAEIQFQENEVELFDASGRALRLQNHSHQLVERGVQIRLQFISDSPTGDPALLRVAYPRLRPAFTGAGLSRRAAADRGTEIAGEYTAPADLTPRSSRVTHELAAASRFAAGSAARRQ